MNWYLTFKALHLIAMVAWFAGLFYMFRLFVYHVESKDKPDVVATLKVMSHKLFYYITTPAMFATFILGFCLLMQVPQHMKAKWFLFKFLFLMGLIIYHYFIGITLAKFKNDELFLTSKQCRIINEIPVLFLVVIILLAVFKPL
ncbi:MAG: CopD family protein [Bdellovibrionales bacterium]|nr:CopD family protein [Bdellovibrionales bacterium]